MTVIKAALFCAFVAVLPIAGAAQAGDGVNQAAAKAALLNAYPGLFTISGKYADVERRHNDDLG